MRRRAFIKAAGLGALAPALSAYAGPDSSSVPEGRTVPSKDKLKVACVGCGGMGYAGVRGVSRENIVALCDVDHNMAAKAFREHGQAKRYRDFRHMLIEMGDQIDAVAVGIPDHMHFPVAMMAIQMGKHVFVQKPLAHTVWEARALALAARKHKVVTQMGNQGHAGEGIRVAKEWIDAGAIGHVREAHVWTEKLTPGGYKSSLRERPKDTPPVPPTLDWNRWLGTSPARPYHPEYHPRKWRGWWDFGCGALGDIGCHTMDAAFWALKLASPVSVEAETGPFTDETTPDWSIVTYRFPARGEMPPVKLVWYDGGKRPERPKHLEKNRRVSKRGYVIVGETCSIMDQSEKCSSPRLIPESRMKSYKRPPKTIPRVPRGDPFGEWIRACKGGPKPGSNFDYSGPLSEAVLLGNVAIMARKKIEWDGKNLRCTNVPEANELVRKKYRIF
ncbi:MAG: Gfo/Idh/MocA family protein [Planctomycetota bacterium]|jgi:predicted dehydrogenase